jgi:hypothetical protein
MAHRSCYPSTEGAPDRKSVLFCPSCALENPVDGGWRHQVRDDGVHVRCPSCGRTLTVRTAADPTPPGDAGESVTARSVRLAVDSVRLSLAWAMWPCGPDGRRYGPIPRTR